MAKTNLLNSTFWQTDKREFEKKLRKLIKRGNDFSPVFHTIGEMFRQSRKTIFDLGSAGGYPDLKESTKRQKAKEVGFLYPILFRHGSLRSSLVDRSDPDNITIIKKTSFAFGTKLHYAKYHNSNKTPRKKIPQRKFVFWGAESRKFQHLTEATRTLEGRAIESLKKFIARDMD